MVLAYPAYGQDPTNSGAGSNGQAVAAPSTPTGPLAAIQSSTTQFAQLSPAAQTLMNFKPSDVKFDVDELMDILRDKRHEGWVLAAYPDPKTAQPLVGAGFSLDLPARPHPQPDPLNPNPFLEPSSAELWQAAGLPPAKLQSILTDFYAHLETDGKKGFRRQIRDLDPQITEDDANALLRVGIIQAALNAKAYCRYFDQMTPHQQMAMTQLVYQMGFNLQQFQTFLGLINRDESGEAFARHDRAYWRDVQMSLAHSQWARLYRVRATAVIAMLDPRYDRSATAAEHTMAAVLHPDRRHRAHKATLRKAALTHHHGTGRTHHTARTRKD